MPPNQDERPEDVSTPESEIFTFPHIPSPIDLTSISTTLSEFSTEPLSPILYHTIEIPQEPTLKELVQRASGLEDVSEVTLVKLQVISVDVSLQHLSYHTPLLRELILDGSIVSSLRDLGCGLKCLKILRVNRCGLKHLDGTFGLESLEELYATKNNIKDISPCSNLPNIKVINVRNNNLLDITALTFLSLCPVLEHITLEENDSIVTFPNYRKTVKSLIPNLKTLDGQAYTEEECSVIISGLKKAENIQKEFEIQPASSFKQESMLPPLNMNSHQPSSTFEGTYIVKFPPKVLSPRQQSSSSESPKDIEVKKMFPEINESKNLTR